MTNCAFITISDNIITAYPTLVEEKGKHYFRAVRNGSQSLVKENLALEVKCIVSSLVMGANELVGPTHIYTLFADTSFKVMYPNYTQSPACDKPLRTAL